MPGTTHWRRRWGFRVAALVAAGVVVQVAMVAWRVHDTRIGLIAGGFGTVTLEEDRTRRVLVKHTWAATDCFSETFNRDWDGGVGWFDAAGLMSRGAGVAEIPTWYRAWTHEEVDTFLRLAEGRTTPGNTSVVTIARAGLGWPFRSFGGDRVYDGIVDTRGSVSYFWTPTAMRSPGYLRVGTYEYPLRPIWLGLVLDVVLLVVAGSVVLSLLDAWRRRRRVREGQCPSCRYDLTGLGRGAQCPECGGVTPSAQDESDCSADRRELLE